MQIMTYWDLLDFAIDEKTGALVDIRQVESGMRCGCICPQCKRRLVARKGPRNRHHFSHLPKDQKIALCSGGAETGLHKAAKQIISRWQSLMPPALFHSEDGRSQFGEIFTVSESIPGDFFPVERGVLPDETYWPGDWVPDVVLFGPKGELRIEIKVTHGISGQKQLKIERDAIQTLEYDVAKLRNDQGWNLDSLEHALKTDPGIVRWAFHLQFADLKAKVHSELTRQIYESSGNLTKIHIALSNQINESSSNLSESASAFGHVDLVFHPWFGLVPKDIKARQEFINRDFAEPLEFPLQGGAAIKIRQHALLKDSWLISFVDIEAPIPRAGVYDSLLSEHLVAKGYRSSYFGIGHMRVVRGANSISPILDFVHRFASPVVPAQAKRRQHHAENTESSQATRNLQSLSDHRALESELVSWGR